MIPEEAMHMSILSLSLSLFNDSVDIAGNSNTDKVDELKTSPPIPKDGERLPLDENIAEKKPASGMELSRSFLEV